MIRTQIQLTEVQARRVRAMARERGVSMAEVVRSCVDTLLDSEAPDRAGLYERASGLVGRFEDRDQATDLSAEHDAYLADVVE